MEDWLSGTVPTKDEVAAWHVVARLVLAALLGTAIAAVHFLTQRRTRTETASFSATLVLLTILLAMVTVVIGNSLARAFGLVGALSIVRFRSVVEDTRDTAFVIFGVVTGMAVGSGFPIGALVSVPVVSLAAVALAAWANHGRAPAPRGQPATLGVKVAADTADPEGVVAGPLAKYLAESTLTAVGTATKGATVELTYAARLRPGSTAVALICDLHRTEGVQAVEWKGPTAG